MENDERRRVAANLRCVAEQRQPYTQPTLACFIGADCMDIWTRLADLIEPDTTTDTTKDMTKSQTISLSPSLCDRAALLKLADEMDAYTRCLDDARCGKQMPPLAIHDFARRIREALGVE